MALYGSYRSDIIEVRERLQNMIPEVKGERERMLLEEILRNLDQTTKNLSQLYKFKQTNIE